MATAKSYLPEGIRSVTPHLPLKNAVEAIAFYKKAFGAELRAHSPGPTPNSTMHADLKIGDSILYLADEMPQSPAKAPTSLGGATVMLTLFVPDCDAVFNRAVAAGAKVLMPPSDMFWGDRYSQLTDPFGHVWSIATHKEDLTAEEMQRRGQAFMASLGK
jgi:PhnB protein